MNQTIFINQQTNTALLPKAESVIYEDLHPKYKVQVIGGYIVTFLLLCAIMGILLYFVESFRSLWWVGLLGLAFAVLILVFISWRSIRYTGYAIRTYDLLYKEGWIYRRITAMPFSSVQHCEISEGPIGRKLGIATIKIYTAGGNGADIEIHGLAKETALQIKQIVLENNHRKVDEEE